MGKEGRRQGGEGVEEWEMLEVHFFNIFSVSHLLDFQAQRSKRPLAL